MSDCQEAFAFHRSNQGPLQYTPKATPVSALWFFRSWPRKTTFVSLLQSCVAPGEPATFGVAKGWKENCFPTFEVKLAPTMRWRVSGANSGCWCTDQCYTPEWSDTAEGAVWPQRCPSAQWYTLGKGSCGREGGLDLMGTCCWNNKWPLGLSICMCVTVFCYVFSTFYGKK